MSELTLENERLRTVIDPALGAGVLAFFAKQGEEEEATWIAVMPDSCSDGVNLNASSFLMIPYSNRIEQGRFAFEGETYELNETTNDPNGHAIHGDVRKRPWDVAERRGDFVRCALDSSEFDYEDEEPVNWPWPFEAQVEYELRDNVFVSRLTLWNRGETDMPAGFGWHPYFRRCLTQVDEPVQLHFRVEGVYPDANGDRIPSGPPQPPAPNQDFRQERPLDPDNFLDICCTGYDGRGTITWPQSKLRLRFRCSDECSHLVLYNPDDPYFAVEPVTNANNGVNLLAQGEPTSGVATLAPGEKLTATFEMAVEML